MYILRSFIGCLSLNCEVEVDYYISNDNFKNTFRKMVEDDILTDCVIKVFLNLKK
jgi:hypothetical protein